MQTNLLLRLLVAFCLSGCATAYQQTGFTGGYSDTQLAPDVFRVNFSGNGATNDERAQDFVMLRAAELTLSHGFTHFAVLNESTGGVTETISTPGGSYTTGSVNVAGRSAYYSGQTTYVPGLTLNIYKPRSGMMVRCFKGQPKGVFALDARFLQSTLRAKYKIKSAARNA
jgi:uncharacterized protein YceK